MVIVDMKSSSTTQDIITAPPNIATKKLSTILKPNERRLVEYFVIVSSVPRLKEGINTTTSTATTTVNSTEDDAHVDPHHEVDYDGLSMRTTKEEEEKQLMEKSFENVDFQSMITGRYPAEDHDGNALHESVACFCHPLGSVRPSREAKMPKVHYFVSTGGRGQQMYGTCLTLYEPHSISSLTIGDNHGSSVLLSPSKDMEVYLPKCLCILSVYPYLVAFREFLCQLNRLTKSGEMPLPLERYIVNFCSEIPAPPPGAFEVQTTLLESVIKLWCPPNNQPIAWVSLPFAHLFQCLELKNIIKVWHALTLERQVLVTSTQLSLLTTCSEVLVSLLYPLKWSHAYIPVLPHFLVPILSAPMPFICGIDKYNLPAALNDLSRECIVVDLDHNQVTFGPQTVPLPPIPRHLENSLLHKLETNVGMVFREVRCLSKKDNYSNRGVHLKPHMKEMADAAWSGQLCLFDEAFHLYFTPEESRKNELNGNDTSGADDGPGLRFLTRREKLANLRSQSQWDAVQEAFFTTYIHLLRNYRKFLVFPSKENEGSYGGAGFRSKQFVASQKFDFKAFLKQFVSTQMFDDFITKRLYGSGESDVIFFDHAIDKVFHSSMIRGLSHDASSGSGPLLQSGRVHRKLKTIVPPEPSAMDLPIPIPSSEQSALLGGALVTHAASHHDDISVVSVGSSSTGVNSSVYSYGEKYDKPQSFLNQEDEHGIGNYCYSYATFPEKLDNDLFGAPRPLPNAVMAEFDRQREDAHRFRRRRALDEKEDLSSSNAFHMDVKPSAEVATFTVFFTAFTAVVGKELIDISNKPPEPDRTILSSYKPPPPEPPRSPFPVPKPQFDDGPFADVASNNSGDSKNSEKDVVLDLDTMEEKQQLSETEDDFKSCGDDASHSSLDQDSLEGAGQKDDDSESIEPTTGTEKITSTEKKDGDDRSQNSSSSHPWRNPVSGFSRFSPQRTPRKDADVKASIPVTPTTPKLTLNTDDEQRSRFSESLSVLEIQEARATSRAQLGLAFEMISMMRQRGLKADPSAYQCLIDACGRCGDTERATQLLTRMHEDGIMADGVVYSCLVNAFSAENAWKKLMGNDDEAQLPDWANGNAVDMDWNKLRKRTYLDIAKEQVAKGSRIIKTTAAAATEASSADDDEISQPSDNRRVPLKQRLGNLVNRRKPPPPSQPKADDRGNDAEPKEMIVTEPIMRQVVLGENLLELLYPDIAIDADTDTCPRCRSTMSDDEVVAGWKSKDSQDYTTTCPYCTLKFVSHFSVQSTSATFMGSRGPSSPLFCERLSPWVLQKELRSVMSDRQGIESLLSPEWRAHETKNAVLWWNLVLSFMRYRLPFSFLMQGSFQTNLIAPSPDDEAF